MTTRASEGTPTGRHLLHIFPSFAVGGAQRRLAELGRLLGARYRHTIIGLDGNFEMAAQLPGEMEFRLARVQFEKSLHLANIPAFRRALKQHAPDVLVTYNWGAIEWALANRWAPIARHVHVEDGFGPDEKSGQLKRRVWMRGIALSGSHTRVVVPSLGLYDIARDSWKLPPKSILHIPNGVDCKRFAPGAGRSARDQIVIGTIAALRPEKNIGRLTDAFAQAAEKTQMLRLLIVGDGPERARLEERAGPLGPAVEFRGATTSPEKALAEMDVFAISSDTEQMPLSVLEAMATGLPVAAVDVGDVRFMLAEDNRAFVTGLSEPEGLSKSLQVLARDGTLRRRLGRANREKAISDFDLDKMAARYAALFG